MEVKEMNIYQKLQSARVELSKMSLKKSATNTFSKYTYFELSDFLPQTQELFLKYGLFAYEEIDSEFATITVIDTDHLETIPFTITIPSTTAVVKGATDIQQIGATQTYMRRYLWMALMEITESDVVDAVSGKDETKKTNKKLNNESKEENEVDVIKELKDLCTAKSKEGKQSEVLSILEKVTGVKNPNAIKDKNKAIKAIEELSIL